MSIQCVHCNVTQEMLNKNSVPKQRNNSTQASKMYINRRANTRQIRQRIFSSNDSLSCFRFHLTHSLVQSLTLLHSSAVHIVQLYSQLLSNFYAIPHISMFICVPPFIPFIDLRIHVFQHFILFIFYIYSV